MTLAKRASKKPSVKKISPNLWFEKIMALLALANYLLVLFDLSYIPLRNFWLQGNVQLFIKIGTLEQEIPEKPLKILPFQVSKWYDWVKGIEPYRDTREYLQKVEDLNEQISQKALQPQAEKSGSAAPPTESVDSILADLRERSREMIDSNPFQIANKTGTLERIKNKMRKHVFGKEDASSKKAFEIFWSPQYLRKEGTREQLKFFDSEIKPLIETNYFRPVGENGEFVNNFGLLDFPFSLLFFADFLSRSWYISRRHAGVSWFDAMLWRWYDIFLFLPVFRFLRIIPVVLRLNQAKLIDLKAIQKQIIQGFVASIAEDITQVVVMQIISQFQNYVEEGAIREFLFSRNVNPYIDLNEINEIPEIIKLVSQLTVRDVLPKLSQDFEAIIQYNMEKAIAQSPGHQGWQQLPGIKPLEKELCRQISTQIYQTFLDVLDKLVTEDPVFDQLIEKLVSNLRQTLGTELKTTGSFEQLESLLAALLEEIKVNYVQKLSQEDIEQILEETRLIRQGNL